MSDAFDDFKAWYDSMQSSGRQQEMAEDLARVRRNIDDAARIMGDLRHGRIGKAEAVRLAKELEERTYKQFQ